MAPGLILFDARELYFLTQYLPVYRALGRRGVECGFVAYGNRPTMEPRMRLAFERLGVPVTWVATKEAGLEHYRKARPDWIFFGTSCGYLDDLPAGTRTAMLYHGIGMKSDVYSPGLVRTTVRFIEGPHYERRVRALYPEANLVPAGYPKLDPLFRDDERPRFDLAAAGLDPARPTLLYAPTHSPSSFPRMADGLPGDFAGCNVLVKPHYLSYFSSSRRSHRRKMDLWSRAPNCRVASLDEWDPLPFMQAADLLISDASAMVFEFAALDRPVVWCDFLKLHLFRRGPFRYRFKRRMSEVYEEFQDVAVHARAYRELRRVVEDELAAPARRAEERRRATRELIGPTDGRAAERVADHVTAARRRGSPGPCCRRRAVAERRALLVDDDPKLRDYVSAGLAASGIACDTAADGEQALAALAGTPPGAFDVLLLDIMLPDRSGWDVLRELRGRGDDTPVIFVTARDAVEERVRGLQLGADDYVIKPFALTELLARIEAVTRRRKQSEVIEVGDLRIEPSHRRAWRGERRIDLSPREFDLLRTLVEHRGRVLSRPELLHRVWGIDFDPETNVVDVHIARLRRKLDHLGPPLIRTVRRSGYQIAAPRGVGP
jgi:DNA-binding response OmpR family regulator